jgi:PRTRC genetic system ThiF family protein
MAEKIPAPQELAAAKEVKPDIIVKKESVDAPKTPSAPPMVLKIDKTYPLVSQKPIDAIFIIGAGGTGSYVVPGLARDISTMAVKPKLVLCDGDIVEEKNLKRQHFAPSDIGRNKAQTLAERYAGAFGFEIGYRDDFIVTTEGFSEMIKANRGSILFISCVDNIKTRMLIREAINLHDIQDNDLYWLDCGNEDTAGQVVLSSRVPWWRPARIERGQYPTPDVFDYYPELFERPDKLPTEMSCAELAAASPQYGFINLTAATLALNYAHDLLHQEPIRTNRVEFSIKNKFKHTPLTEANIESWSAFFDKFTDFDYFEKKRMADKLRSKREKAKGDPEKDTKKDAKKDAKDINAALGR